MNEKSKRHEKIELGLYYTLKILIALGLVWALINKDWTNSIFIALIFLLTYLPRLVKKKYKIYLPIEFELFIVSFIFLSLFLGEVYSYYHKIWWWDLYLHTVSGFLLGIAGFLLVFIMSQSQKIRLQKRPGFVALFAFSFAISAGVIWEIFEFLMDSFFGFNMLKSGLMDTMGDLIVDVIGAAVICFIGYLWMKKKLKFFVFDHSISLFVKKNLHLFDNEK